VTDPEQFLAQLATRYKLATGVTEQLQALAEWSVSLEISGTAVRTLKDALTLHIADSLGALELESVRAAGKIADIGAGVGFPGLVLAAAMPAVQVTLVDSVRKKMEAAAALAHQLGIENVDAVWARAEDFSAIGGPARESFDVVTARAVAPLNVLVEYAAPLLTVGGSLVAWKGAPDEEELDGAAAAEQEIGFGQGELVETRPFAHSRNRHFYIATKTAAVSERYPRRPGAALRKPIRF
jgi:16S rRNA (guanine527-N7)-methyltransferase